MFSCQEPDYDKADFSCQEPEHDGEEHGWAEEGRGLEGGKQRGREQGQQAQVLVFFTCILWTPQTARTQVILL